MDQVPFFKQLADYLSDLESEFALIATERKELLDQLGTYVLGRIQSGQTCQLTVICTHNSRRSHLGQVWLRTAAWYFDLPALRTFSGGTEATAFNPRAVEALRRAGFTVDQRIDDPLNPNYCLSASPAHRTDELFSKRYDHPNNPADDFAAIMVCSEADDACPFIPGASARFAIRYRDPKEADGLAEEAAVYDERCRQIAREAFYCMASVRQALTDHRQPAP